jgi:hypothetical protein
MSSLDAGRITLHNKGLQYDLPQNEIPSLCNGLVKWIKDFEKCFPHFSLP